MSLKIEFYLTPHDSPSHQRTFLAFTKKSTRFPRYILTCTLKDLCASCNMCRTNSIFLNLRKEMLVDQVKTTSLIFIYLATKKFICLNERRIINIFYLKIILHRSDRGTNLNFDVFGSNYVKNEVLNF